MTVQRPTWNLGDEIHSGSRAAKDIDLAASTAEALAGEKYYSRMNEPQSVVTAAVQYAASCMAPVLVPMAVQAREQGHITEPGGWQLRVESESHKEMCLSLTHPGAPGGWCVSIDVDQEMIDIAKQRLSVLDQSIKEKLEAHGLNHMQIFYREIGIGGKDIEKLPEELERSNFKADRTNYRSIGPGHEFSAMRAYALRLPEGGINGHGRAGAQSDTESFSSIDIFDSYAKRDGWASGLSAQLIPARHHRDDELLTPSSDRDGVMPERFMGILSNLITANGYEPTVRAREAELSTRGWISFGSGNSHALQEVGHGLIHQAGGLWTPEVTDAMRDFSAEIAACDVRMNVGDWIRLARNLEEQGNARRADLFSANDGRDEAWAENDGDTLTIRHETQHGKFRTDILLRDGALQELHCYRERPGAPDIAVGRFRADGQGVLQHDYAGTLTHDVEVAYNIRNIRDMNGIIGSLSSLACVMDEELEARNVDDSPSP
ncbi:hypothetical protein [Paracoccus sp. ME4]|uniref:hypothetical protein n=1 Tax=Paracoccus sp. ME4 TaxID=3138066 RepID=UPI00398B0353